MELRHNSPFAKMSRHLEKVLAHAEKELASAGKNKTTDLLSLYRRFLKIEDHRLRLRHQAGGGGREIAQQRVALLDIVLRHLFVTALEEIEKKPEEVGLSILAIGGYGRGELNPFSDVDIMFLHDGKTKPSAETSAVVERILYLLWDVGFKVGHSVRSVPEAIRQGNEDLMSKTALLEARLLTGQKMLHAQFEERYIKTCVKGREREYILWRIRNQKERHVKHNGTVYVQEPNIKNGCGGLRDYQNLLWVGYFAERVRNTAEMVGLKLLNEAERRSLEQAYDFLLRIRTELHYVNKRSADILTIHSQGQIANRLGYPQKSIIRRSEAFMKEYFQHARNIYLISQTAFERMVFSRAEEKSPASIALHFLAKKPKPPEVFDGFCSEKGLIFPAVRDVFRSQPGRLMRVFQHAQQRELALSPELQQLIRRNLKLVNRTFQYSRAARETFEAILSRKGVVGRTLRMMHEVDFLGAYLPEFGGLTCLVQHEFYHQYTADEHTLVCIEKLDRVIDTEDPKLANYRLLFQKIQDPFILYLSLLLHDTGKAANSRHHADASALNAQRVARRMQITPDRRKMLILLVDHHVTLSETAQRRNLDDPATTVTFSGIIKNQGNLDALMLLTLADGMGTSDQGWSDWKESLVWQLHRATIRFLSEGESGDASGEGRRQELRDEVRKKLAKDFASEIEAHFQYMPERYFRMFDGAEVGRHIRLFRGFFEKEVLEMTKDEVSVAIRWLDHPERGHSELLVCTWDRRELLARIAGAISLAGLNILSADVFTRGDNLVLDSFRLCDASLGSVQSEKDKRKVESVIFESLQTLEFDFKSRMDADRKSRKSLTPAPEVEFPTKITISNEMHPHCTLIEVVTPDRLGLLHGLLGDLSAMDINIELSRITTEKGAAIDSFYVTSAKGGKLKESQLAQLQERLTHSAAGVPLRSRK